MNTEAAIDAVKKLAADVGILLILRILLSQKIFHSLHSLHMMMHAVQNPRETSVEEITKLYESLI